MKHLNLDDWTAQPEPTVTVTGTDILAEVVEMIERLPPRPAFQSMAAHPQILSRLAEAPWPNPEPAILPRIFGMPIFTSPSLTRDRQVRFPRSKKKRIRKKWRKDRRNWITEPDPHVYMLNTVTMGV